MDHHHNQQHHHMGSGADTLSNTPIRSGTPEVQQYHDTISPAPRLNPFASPFSTRPSSPGPNSIHPSSSAVDLNQQVLSRRYFHSRRVRKGEVEKPWLAKKDPREKWVTIIPLIGLGLGLALAGFLIYDGLHSVVNHVYCPVLDEDWSGGFNSKVWTKEAEVGGFGNGQFEETTVTDENVYVENGALVIKPTLQDQKLIDADNTIDLTKQGICSSTVFSDCVVSTNTTNGTIVNPVKSGRVNSKKGATIKYGRVEVTATLPSGDWLWPAIWLLPVNNVYGVWPRSGEIDIVESRGNNYTYAQGGDNIISSALHWGPNSANDAWWKTNVKRNALHTTFAKSTHTFGLEWSEKYLFTYIDTRLLQVLYVNFDQPLFQQGDFGLSDSNGTMITDPWSQTGRDSTPFDQDFYLILNVAVGGTNGWFEDGQSGKPWVDSSPTARKDFWTARDTWYPTWQDHGWMEIHRVQMWQQQGYNGC